MSAAKRPEGRALSWRERISSRRRFEDYRRRREQPAPRAGGPRDHEPAPQKHRSLARLYRELNRLLRGQRLSIALALGLLSFATLLKLVPPAATKLVIDNVLLWRPVHVPARMAAWVPTALAANPRVMLGLLVAVVLGVSFLGTAVGLYGRWRATQASKRIQVVVRRAVFEHAVRLPLHRIYQLKSGGAASLLREDAGGVGELIFSMLYNPWRAVVQLLGGLIVLVWVDWRLLLGAICLAPGFFWTERLWNRTLRPLYRDVRKERQDIDAMAAEAFGGMRVVRAFGRQRRESARFVAANDLLTRQELFAWQRTRSLEILWDLLLPGASAALLLYGGLRVLDGRLSLGDLMMFLVYLAMLLEPIAVLATSGTQLQNNLSGFDRVLDLLAEPREMADHPGHRVVRKSAVAGRITLEGVSFAYPGSDQLVLRGIDLEVAPGEVVALVGRSGAGKTTLCNLVARFHDPTEGVIRLDGTDLREIQVESYRRLLGIVEQDVFLFDGTIAENIAYADPRASRTDVERAARIANADEFIAALPEGFDTVIGERGVKLSGGQRQRLAISRAVLAEPRIFILDEATSNLDTASERLIQNGLEALLRDRTSFVIAHRLSTIRRADRILVLDHGAVIETGSHLELMAASGAYRDMVELQRLGGEEG
jgi:ATP-binding cassette subfamily B protein/subfamily B ATP-binding cassette protein MsbA